MTGNQSLTQKEYPKLRDKDEKSFFFQTVLSQLFTLSTLSEDIIFNYLELEDEDLKEKLKELNDLLKEKKTDTACAYSVETLRKRPVGHLECNFLSLLESRVVNMSAELGKFYNIRQGNRVTDLFKDINTFQDAIQNTRRKFNIERLENSGNDDDEEKEKHSAKKRKT